VLYSSRGLTYVILALTKVLIFREWKARNSKLTRWFAETVMVVMWAETDRLALERCSHQALLLSPPEIFSVGDKITTATHDNHFFMTLVHLVIDLTKARFPLPELTARVTARVDGWPVSITRQHGPCWWATVSTSKPSWWAVLTGNGNRSPVNSGR